MISEKLSKIISSIMSGYISFVYKTSKVQLTGFSSVQENKGEKVVFAFWHGDSYCLYPAFLDHDLYVITTKNRRGDYIADTCQRFGYHAIRIPDNSDGGNYIFKIKKKISEEDMAHLAIPLDGPLGPYHIPKYFPIAIAYLAKRNIIPVSIKVKRKVELKRRWDAFKIPLPFNQIDIQFHDPVKVDKEDKDEKFVSIIQNIKQILE